MLGAHLVLLFFIAWQFARFSQCLRYYIRCLPQLVIAMDCDELTDELMSVAEQRQGAGAGLAKGAPQAAAPAYWTAATPDTPEGWEEERVQRHRARLAAIAAGGQAGQYGLVVRGKAVEQLQAAQASWSWKRTERLDFINEELRRVTARKTARLPLSSWGWPQPAWWPTDSPSNTCVSSPCRRSWGGGFEFFWT